VVNENLLGVRSLSFSNVFIEALPAFIFRIGLNNPDYGRESIIIWLARKIEMSGRVFLSYIFIALLLAGALAWSQSIQQPQPIIDMHMHAHTLSMYGTLPPSVCTNDQDIIFPGLDPKLPITHERVKLCPSPVKAPTTDQELMSNMILMLERYNIRAVTSGPLEQVSKWRSAAPERINPAVPFDEYGKQTPEVFRRLFGEGKFAVFAEISSQYNGVEPTDSSLEPYFALAEELDIPVGIHMGEGPPGASYRGYPKYRARLTSPFLLEEVLIRHPKLRIYVMHYGSPLVDDMISMLFSHPQLYVDVAGNNWMLPRKEFHRHLQRLVEAGYGKRIMFGSDAMIWPKTIPVAIESIEKAEFLSAEQKRDIFYNNAARFLRLTNLPQD
jgi:predicted TIM-barrel fold metal-dependent hydrolase